MNTTHASAALTAINPLVYKTDQAEFEALFQRSQKRAYRLAYRLCGNIVEAEDITQDAYMRAWSHFHQWDHTRPFETWLFRIITNLVIDARRRRNRRPTLSLDAPFRLEMDGDPMADQLASADADPALQLQSATMEEALQKAMDALPKDYRQVVELCDLEEMNYEEIALKVGCPVGTVRSRLHRARQALRRSLEKAPEMKPHLAARH
jgi:RNA polymerase sigma-70 factor (ECF subfamily)